MSTVIFYKKFQISQTVRLRYRTLYIHQIYLDFGLELKKWIKYIFITDYEHLVSNNLNNKNLFIVNLRGISNYEEEKPKPEAIDKIDERWICVPWKAQSTAFLLR